MRTHSGEYFAFDALFFVDGDFFAISAGVNTMFAVDGCGGARRGTRGGREWLRERYVQSSRTRTVRPELSHARDGCERATCLPQHACNGSGGTVRGSQSEGRIEPLTQERVVVERNYV